MQSRSRDRLAYPVAAIVALGLVSAPPATTSVPRLVEVSAVQLQAEVTALVTGIEGTLANPAAAAAASSLAGKVVPTACTYPCTIFDKWLSNLPPNVRNALLPPLYAVSFVVGLVLSPVLLATSALFGWPYSLRPAAAITPAATAPTTVVPEAAPAEPIAPSSVPGSDPTAPSSTPGVDRVDPDAAAVVNEPAEATAIAATRDRNPAGRAREVAPAAAATAEAVTAGVEPDSADPATDQPAGSHSRASRGGARDAAGPAAAAAKR